MHKIRFLEENTINKIAAGGVLGRAASEVYSSSHEECYFINIEDLGSLKGL